MAMPAAAAARITQTRFCGTYTGTFPRHDLGARRNTLINQV
jgi:hypothetical protein